jgi:membrane protease subunit (stomatin/prohibitin family)
MAILELIEWAKARPDELVHRVPETGSGEFRLGSQLVVREFQTALFFHNGSAQDRFEAGRYTLETENIPLLTSVLALPFGGTSPFRTEVYFVSRKRFLDLKWGTPQTVALRDPDLGLARLRSFGTFALHVVDPALVVNQLVGGQGLFSTDEIVGYLRGVIASRFADVLGEARIGLFDLPAHYDDLAALLAQRVKDEFAANGLELAALFVTSISTTEETQQAIDERAAMGAIGDMTKYLQFKAAQGLGESGGAGVAAATFGLGAGAGMGAAMAQSLSGTLGPAPGPPATGMAGRDGALPTSDLQSVFDALAGLVAGQLSLPETERADLTQALSVLRQALAAPEADLAQIRAARATITGRWPWMAEPLATAMAQPAASTALAAATNRYLAAGDRAADPSSP